MPAQSASFAVLSGTAATAGELHVDAAECSRLLEVLALVPDPRKRRGVRHSVAAVLAGCRSVLAIGEWAAEAPQVVLAVLRARQHPLTGRFKAPHIDTFRRVLRLGDAEAVDRAIGVFLAERAGLGAADSPLHDTDPSAQNGQPGNQLRPAQDTPTPRGLSVDGKAVRGADPARRACGAPAGGDDPRCLRGPRSAGRRA